MRSSSKLFAVLTITGAALAGAQPAPGQSPADTPSERGETPTPPAKAAPDVPTFGAEVELVTVDVVVTDEKGRSVEGLTVDDFTIVEDGEPQTIVSFEAVELPDVPDEGPSLPPSPVSSNAGRADEARTRRSFAIVFDDVHLSPFQAQRAKAAVGEFLTNGTREGDQVSLVSSSGEAWWTTRMPGGRGQLLDVLERLDGRYISEDSREYISPYEAMRIWVHNDRLIENRVARRFEELGLELGPMISESSGPFRHQNDPVIRSRASQAYAAASARMRATLGVMKRALEALGEGGGRNSLIVVSSGFIYDSSLARFKSVLDASQRSNAAIYFLDTRGLEGLPSPFGVEYTAPLGAEHIEMAFLERTEAAEGAESLALDSGGFVVSNTNDLAEGIARIAQATQNFYLLGYYPSNTARDGRFRKIEVDVEGRGLDVRARRGYYAPGGDTEAADGEEPVADSAFQRAIDSPAELEDIPLRMTAYVYEATASGKARVLVVAEADVSDFEFETQVVDGRARHVDTLQFFVVVAHRDSAEYFTYDQSIEMKLLPETLERVEESWQPIVRDFELAPGGYQAKTVVRAASTGLLGSVTHEFQVPELDRLRTSTLVLSDTLDNWPRREGGPAPQPRVLARREFEAGITLYCQFAVFGAQGEEETRLPRVCAGYEVRDADGRVVKAGPPTPIQPTSLGALSRIFGMTLEGAAPGRYELVLEVTDELAGETIEIREPFWLKAKS